MRERKIKEDLNCGITVAMRVFGSKWKPCLIDAIARRCHRPSEMHRMIPDATPRVLDMQLGELLAFGVVMKRTGDGFPLHTEYYLTNLGESILPIVEQLDNWGKANNDVVKARVEKLATGSFSGC